MAATIDKGVIFSFEEVKHLKNILGKISEYKAIELNIPKESIKAIWYLYNELP